MCYNSGAGTPQSCLNSNIEALDSLLDSYVVLVYLLQTL